MKWYNLLILVLIGVNFIGSDIGNGLFIRDIYGIVYVKLYVKMMNIIE